MTELDVREMRISCFNVMHSFTVYSRDSTAYIYSYRSSVVSHFPFHLFSVQRASISRSLVHPLCVRPSFQFHSRLIECIYMFSCILTSDAEQTIKHNTICQICIWMTYNACEASKQARVWVCLDVSVLIWVVCWPCATIDTHTHTPCVFITNLLSSFTRPNLLHLMQLHCVTHYYEVNRYGRDAMPHIHACL